VIATGETGGVEVEHVADMVAVDTEDSAAIGRAGDEDDVLGERARSRGRRLSVGHAEADSVGEGEITAGSSPMTTATMPGVGGLARTQPPVTCSMYVGNAGVVGAGEVIGESLRELRVR
jgi:hypothetical protein